MGGVGPQVIAEADPATDARLCPGPGFASVQIDACILQGPPEACHVEGMTGIGPKECPRVVEIPGFAVHRDLGPGPLQSVGPVEGGELRPLVGVDDFGRPERVDGLVQRHAAEPGLQRIGDAPGQHLAGEPVDDGDQLKEALAHGQIGDVGATCPDWAGRSAAFPADGDRCHIPEGDRAVF